MSRARKAPRRYRRMPNTLVRCEACNKLLHPAGSLMFERSLDGKKVEDSALVKTGFSCPDIDCLTEATGIADEVKRERDDDGE